MKKIAILGSTGKIGTQALEVIRSCSQDFEVVGLASGHESEKFRQQVKEFRPKITAVAEKDGENKVVKVATHPEVEMVIIAIVGLAGLKPTLAAIKAGKDIALATKEVLVIAGELVMREVKKQKTKLIPLDSEHSAIFQCLHSGRIKEVRQIILTMGKGPIAKMSKNQLKKVTVKDVFSRPAWSMGQKIAVDSATCMNKTFEVIEARWLFDINPKKIKIVVHPEYFCHSLVEFVDGSILTEIGSPDMRRYLQYALFYPKRKAAKIVPRLNLIGKKITFEKPPLKKFPCLKIGYQALKKGGTTSAVMHGVDKVAVDAFISGQIKFTEIPSIISSTIKSHKAIKNPKLDQLIKAEKWGQEFAQRLIKKGGQK